MGAIMLQGTGSDVGKSVIVAGLCRAFANRGLTVRPFKPQNMSNNAAVTVDGGEIGRAQALQALACRVPAHTDMNPVLLKPQADHSSQLIVQGRVAGILDGRNFRAGRASLLPAIMESYARLKAQADLVIVEGAGSPAEINLRTHDVANMGFARAAHVPVVLIGDIDRGGVIASIFGTKAVIDAEDAAMIAGFLINKFRGNISLFTDGYDIIAERTGWPGLGIIPWLADVRHLPSEDAVILEKGPATAAQKIKIACPILPRIANFDELDPWRLEPSVELVMVSPGQPIPADAAIIILPGSKATISDFQALKAEGWDIDLLAHHRRGGMIFGICGGYQMLGLEIADPLGIEGPCGAIAGLGLLNIKTSLSNHKQLRPITGTALGASISGYEMHIGESHITGPATSFANLEDGASSTLPDGAVSPCGRVIGSNIHGLFASADFRHMLLQRIGEQGAGADYHAHVDRALDSIAADLEKHVDLDRLAQIAGLPTD